MKQIPNYSRYSVSEDGKIYSTNYKNSGKTKELNPSTSKDGYPQTMLQRDDGKYCTKKVHWFIALAFLGERGQGLEVNHKNGIKTDNRISNLEYVTRSENVKHAYENGLAKRFHGSSNHFSKLTEKDVLEIRAHVKNSPTRHYGRKELAKKYGISEGHLKKIVNSKDVWNHI